MDGAQAAPHLAMMCRRSTAIFMFFRDTRFMGRRASACFTGSAELLEAMPPYQGGGDMISSVTFEKTLQRAAL